MNTAVIFPVQARAEDLSVFVAHKLDLLAPFPALVDVAKLILLGLTVDI